MARPYALAGLLGAAVGGPYLISNAPEGWPTATTNASQVAVEAPPTIDPRLLARPEIEGPHGPGSQIYRRPAPLEGRVHRSLDEILRWEINKDWVFATWDRKSTGLADPELFGVRVPVVTGHAMTDVAGALSYYFDAAGQLQRIRLVGTTADTTQLAQIVSSRFAMQRRVSLSPGEQLFQANEENRVRSELRTRPEAVMWGTSPHNSFRVELEVNRPGSRHWIKPPALSLASRGGATTGAENISTKPSATEPTPVFPARSVVPDEEKVAAVTTAQGTPPPPSSPSASPDTAPKTAASAPPPDSDTAPLDSYRRRFRWPD
ncbi:DUF6690 family protein [Botrimarina hoheduenensis]|uniref:DUF6690 domain-containing protein n=1 Tax=Botrimarina hoheduenensis TaxID=2528000 RepID=A0A5C5VXI5_9BACT|nr:DUF6690 family protein [Botrimarina hoheduenensis]TWT42847.1 hypothetical protein Pla111_24850 [Botrimarina hoheduenensis]